jgi:hypothetical protein
MQTLTVGYRYRITGGVSKDRLIAQLFDIGRYKHRATIAFTLTYEHDHDDKFQVEVLVNGMDAEDGSGESWIIRGYIPTTVMKFEAYFDVRYRKGWIIFS